MLVLLEIARATWLLVLQSAAYLLGGFILAGLMHAFVPADRLVRWVGRPDWRSVLKAAAIGTPLPLCSCAVVPVAAELRKAGASRGATTAFLISTPESGVDSIAISYGLLDPMMTVARPVAAMLTAVVAGLAENLLIREEPSEQGGEQTAVEPSCGAATCDCETRAAPVAPPRGWLQRVGTGLYFGLV